MSDEVGDFDKMLDNPARWQDAAIELAGMISDDWKAEGITNEVRDRRLDAFVEVVQMAVARIRRGE